MNTIASTPRQQIQSLLGQVRHLKSTAKSLENGYQDGYYASQDAGRDIQSTQWPLRRAQSDTVNTNVSYEGRQAEQSLRQADRRLRENESRLYRIGSSSSSATREFDLAKQNLQQILSNSSAYPSEVYTNLQQAKGSLDSSARDHDTANGQGGWAESKNKSASRELQWAEHNVRNITWDRPGVDVSHDARQASFRVDQAQWAVRDCDNNLSQARSFESRSGQGLGQVEQSLRQALAQLPE